MRISQLLIAGVAFCAASISAYADPLAESLTPNVSLGLQFGGGAQRAQLPMRFTAQFDVRSQLLRRDLELARTSTASGSSAVQSNSGAGLPLLTIFQFGASKKGFDLINVMGYDMLAKSDLMEAGESHWYSHKWIWWTAGAVIATGAALAAAGGSDNSNNNGPGAGAGAGAGSGSGGGNNQACVLSGNVGTTQLPSVCAPVPTVP